MFSTKLRGSFPPHAGQLLKYRYYTHRIARGSLGMKSWNSVALWRRAFGARRRIKYFSFWDVPRTFAFEYSGKVYMLTSEFDDALDEYPDDYEVFVVSDVGDLSMVSDWKSLEPMPKTSVGRVPIASVRFDESRRKYVDGSVLGHDPATLK
jgi:hypothetical protein